MLADSIRGKFSLVKEVRKREEEEKKKIRWMVQEFFKERQQRREGHLSLRSREIGQSLWRVEGPRTRFCYFNFSDCRELNMFNSQWEDIHKRTNIV